MKPVDQEFINIPGVQYGDCQRACIASLLELPIAEVPHFLAIAEGDPETFWELLYEFCESKGYQYHPWFTARQMELEDDLDGYCVISGPSPRGGGILHAVIGRYDQVVFDPHPSKTGLSGDPSEWTFDYLVKL